MTTLAIFALQGFLIIAALWRSKSDRIVLVLLAAWAAASIIGPMQGEAARQPALSLIDALIGVGMALLWSTADDWRAWSVGLIAWFKVALRLCYVTLPTMDHYWFAAMINCALIAQAIIAGGFVDAIGYRLDDLLRRFFPSRHGLLHNGTK